MLTHISETETLKDFASLVKHPSNQLNRPPTRIISQRQKHVLYIIARQKSLSVDGLDRHCNRLFNKKLDELDRIEASDMMRYFNSNIIPARR